MSDKPNGGSLNPRPYFPPPMTKKLVQMVNEHECLVNHYDNTYMGRCKRMDAWKEITVVLNHEFGLTFTTKQLKKKFFNLEQGAKHKFFGNETSRKRESSMMATACEDDESIEGESVTDGPAPVKMPSMTETEREYVRLFNNKWRHRQGGKINTIASKLKKNSKTVSESPKLVDHGKGVENLDGADLALLFKQLTGNNGMSMPELGFGNSIEKDNFVKFFSEFIPTMPQLPATPTIMMAEEVPQPQIKAEANYAANNPKAPNQSFLESLQALHSNEANNNEVTNGKTTQHNTSNEESIINSCASQTRIPESPNSFYESKTEVYDAQIKAFSILHDQMVKLTAIIEKNVEAQNGLIKAVQRLVDKH
uniref:MADF domain-containing protein n=1 Tax=Rhabditophanes sp. KR3021 TaxID=114890 RepID=A0AC35TQZ9_9BILA